MCAWGGVVPEEGEEYASLYPAPLAGRGLLVKAVAVHEGHVEPARRPPLRSALSLSLAVSRCFFVSLYHPLLSSSSLSLPSSLSLLVL
jgi:hypothetical protein